MIEIQPTKLILLTGAGFSKNYGGFLAKEMWAKIFNHPEIQETTKIRKLMLENFDFEDVWGKVLSSEEYAKERAAIFNALPAAYKELDEAIRSWVFNDDNPIAFNTYGLGGLLNMFVGNGQEQGIFFTLNQDLLMERKSGHKSLGTAFANELYKPGVEFRNNHTITLPHQDKVDKINDTIKSQGGLLYVKLHGSFGWVSPDGQAPLVIGHNKSEHIQKEPLLKYYSDFFKNVISRGGRRMLIIGYGFRDDHINEILADGVSKHGLELLIITTQQPDLLLPQLCTYGKVGLSIWSGVVGYFPYTLREIFPPNQVETAHFREIKKALER